MKTVKYQEEYKSGVKYVWEKSNKDKDQKWKDVLNDIEKQYTMTYVVIDNDEVHGFITVTKKEVKDKNFKPNYIWEFYAHPRGQGYGSELMNELKEKEERSYLYLHVKKDNTDTIEKYEHMKFVKNGCNLEKTKYRMVWRS